MGRIEEIYYDWSDNERNGNEEFENEYRKITKILTGLIGSEKFNEIDDMIMDCVCLERKAAFIGGFQQATAIWKEC